MTAANPLGLSPHRHSAKLLPHHHTSYGGIALLLGMVGILTVLITMMVALPGNADSGAITVSGTVPAAPPAGAPMITAPATGTQTSDPTITVGGSCSPGLTVVVDDNQTGRGSALCDAGGSFSLVVSLTAGSNVLAAYQLDNLNQSGPLSQPVTVTYTPSSAPGSASPAASRPPGSSSSSVAAPAGGSSSAAAGSAAAGAFSVTAPYRFDGVRAGQSFTLLITLAGGSAPYAVQIDWGDHSQLLVSRAVAGQFSAQHTYAQPGHFIIKLQATDAAGATSYYQTTVTVGGAGAIQPAPAPAPPAPVVPAYELMIIWPLFLVICLVAFSFWLGERYDRSHWRSPPPAA